MYCKPLAELTVCLPFFNQRQQNVPIETHGEKWVLLSIFDASR